MNGQSAVTVKIKGRYFCRFGKLGQLQTAWSLAGGTLFLPGSDNLAKVVKALCKKGTAFEVMVVAVVA